MATFDDSTLSPDVRKLLETFADLSQPSAAILVATQVESALVELLRLRMRGLNSNLKSTMFSGYGPLATFSARIDVARAFELVSAEQHAILVRIKNVRNVFAHAKAPLTFKSTEVIEKWKGVRFPYSNLTAIKGYLAAASDMIRLLEASAKTQAIATALMQSRAEPEPLPERSTAQILPPKRPNRGGTRKGARERRRSSQASPRPPKNDED